MPPPETPESVAPSPVLRITPWHRRLARYLYLDDLIRGRRVLEIGCGDGRAAAFLAQRGAAYVLGVDGNAEAIARGREQHRHSNLTLRHVERGDLCAAGGLGEPSYDLVLVAEAGGLLGEGGFLQELRRVLAPDGHVVVAAPSKEADPRRPGAMSYFDLVDLLGKVGQLGPVTMLGQNPFLATIVVPFGVEEPPLVMDDSLTVPEPPEEYVALCGPGTGRALPYQVIQLPQAALDIPVAAPELAEEIAQLRAEREGLAKELAALQAAGVDAAAERDRLQGELAQSAAAQEALKQCLEQAEQRLRAAEAQTSELRERIALRDQGAAEQAEAVVLFEQKLRELRGVLEERDAYIAELEAQAQGAERLREQATEAQHRAGQAEQAERVARQRLAEVEGMLLRAQAELQAQREGGAVPGALPSLETAVLEQRRHEAEEALRRLQEERQALVSAQHALSEDRQTLARSADEVARLREELVAEQAQLAREREELARLRDQLARERQAGSPQDDVPVPVGDLPTAPHVSFAPAAPLSPHEELQRLQARVAELEAENSKLKEKASDAERESWKYMKARSDAEAEAAAVREDAARRLRDARKLASVELTRAMEEATKKAVQLREELTRVERERKDAMAQVKELRAARDAALRQVDALRQEIEALRWSSALASPSSPVEGGDDVDVHREVARAREEGAAAVLAVRAEAERAIADERAARQSAQEAERRAKLRLEELRATVLQLELQLGEARDNAESERRRVEMLQEEVRRLADEAAARQREGEAELLRVQQELELRDRSIADLRMEREALGRLLQEVEREAYSRAERARELRARMLERDREVEALRVELLDRDRKITALEKQVPPSEEISRLEAELQAARARLQELEAERGRQDAASDEAVATALRERARAARLTESLQQAVRERDEAQNRLAELEQRLQALVEERARLRGESARLEEIVRRTQAEAQQLGERLKQTRRELEAEEKRAAREAERAQAAAELGQLLDEARGELANLRVRTLELQAELAKSRAELARLGGVAGATALASVPGTAAAAITPGAEVLDSGAPAGSTATQSDAPPGDGTASAMTPVSEVAPEQSVPERTPVLHEHTVRRVLALGQALGLEPLQVPLQPETSCTPERPGEADHPSKT